MLTNTSATAGAQGNTLGQLPSTFDFIKTLFAHTTETVYVCSFPNERYDETQVGERRLMTRDFAQINKFMTNWDRPGRGMFVCVATVNGDKRNKQTVRESTALFADVDFEKIDGLPDDPQAAREHVLKQLTRLKFAPSIIVWSGGGLHLYWLLKEALPTQEHVERIEADLRQLADLVAGDLPVCEVARVLRLPGSHNTKRGDMRPVEIIELHADRRYDIEELEEWLSEQSPIMLRKAREHAQPAGETDFFAEYAKQHGIKAPIDVEARLAAMMFMGGEESSIHQTQLAVTAALLNRGMPKEDVVSVVLDATKRAAAEYGTRWNWRREERKLNGMCDTWLKKNPPDEKKKREYTEAVEREQRIAEQRAERPVEKPKLTSIEGGKAAAAAAAAVATRPVIIPNEDPHVQLGRAVLAGFLAKGEELIITKDGSWFYSAGVWELRVEPKWLNVRIEKACVDFGFKSATKLINEARNWIERRPELWRDGDLPWDQHGKIPTRSGLIDPRTGALETARADHYCTWRVDVDYDPEATCPWWEMMLADMFGDKVAGERDALIGVVQELVGAALIDKKPRGLAKACVFWGSENRAKSGVLDVVAGLFGNRPITAGIGTVDGTHGLMPFVRRAPWVLHEAFGPQWHMSATVKAIVTGEPVQINIKNGPMFGQIVRAPIFWATNFQPQFKESTRAIVSRMIVFEVTRAFNVKKPIGAAAEAISQGYSKPGELIIATELPGVLNWAIAGLRRALERGSIAETESIAETANAIHQDSNLVAGFLEDCIEFDPNARLKVADFCLAHSAWWMELKGEDRRLPKNEAVSKALKAIDDHRIGMHRKQMRDSANRYYCGIALNKSGLDYHRIAYQSRLFEGKVGKATDPAREVNAVIPATWDARESVIKMREHHSDRVTNDQNDDAHEVPGH
ncbi:hypothetical protein ACVI1J_002283 [Bradyrhizobium diazoefficiens]